MIKEKAIAIFVGLLIITSLIFLYTGIRIGNEEGYEDGYFYGWHESQFIDCTLPSLNKTMNVVFYDVDVMGQTWNSYLSWEEMCGELKDLDQDGGEK